MPGIWDLSARKLAQLAGVMLAAPLEFAPSTSAVLRLQVRGCGMHNLLGLLPTQAPPKPWLKLPHTGGWQFGTWGQPSLLHAFAVGVLDAHAPDLPSHSAPMAVASLHFCWRLLRTADVAG